ncbi:hypothetical protein P8452_13312 [Trifolium repens]|nr:hypothetical protein P8452_13312 [Trifolium repens]
MEEQLREDGEACVPTWRNVWTKTYEGLPMSDVFPSGPLDTTVLMGYACHVARYIYDSHERELISNVSNSGKVASFKHEEWNTAWWERALKDTRIWGLAQTGYSFLDPEFTAPPNNERKNSTPHIQKVNIPMERDGYLIYGTTHMHTGVINATLYGQDGRTLYTSEPTYEKGKEPGNEKGYVVGRSGSYPKFVSIKIKNGEIVTAEIRYKSGFRTKAM